jgi:hypothetical protein
MCVRSVLTKSFKVHLGSMWSEILVETEILGNYPYLKTFLSQLRNSAPSMESEYLLFCKQNFITSYYSQSFGTIYLLHPLVRYNILFCLIKRIPMRLRNSNKHQCHYKSCRLALPRISSHCHSTFNTTITYFISQCPVIYLDLLLRQIFWLVYTLRAELAQSGQRFAKGRTLRE